MNKLILMGRLTRDPEIRYSQGAQALAIARFSIAVDRKFKREGEPEADFFNCVAFGKPAEFVERYLHKGIKILLTGRVQNNNYTKSDGQKVYETQVVIEEIEFAESKNASANQNTAQTPQYGSAPQQQGYYTGNDGFMNIPDGIDEELPFN